MAELNTPTYVERPPTRMYEVRTTHGGAYRAEGDIIESGDGWFTLWADEFTLALRVPEADVRAVRMVPDGELEQPEPSEGPACSEVPGCDGQCCKRRDKDQEIRGANEVIERLSGELAEARTWARHGYEIGQKHCSWSDHGVAPAWLTEGWPRSFDSCEHLKQAAEYDEALTRVRNLPDRPDVMDARQPNAGDWLAGYRVGVLDAKSAARPGNEGATQS